MERKVHSLWYNAEQANENKKTKDKGHASKIIKASRVPLLSKPAEFYQWV